MTVTLKRRTSYIVLTLDQPDKLNALSPETIDGLRQAFDQVETRSEIRCAILTGTGDRAFSAGTNITELTGLDEDLTRAASERFQALCNQIESCSVPVIAAVNGVAGGNGCELALACHIRIASQNASFSFPETKLDTLPGYGRTERLAQEIGRGRALEIILAGRTVCAEEARRIGLINRIVADGVLLTEAESLAREISNLAPLAIRACLEAVTRGIELPLAEGLAVEAQLFSSLFATNDMREGTRAFLEKRSAVFKGS
jgi:enoyl-CoA hydratase